VGTYATYPPEAVEELEILGVDSRYTVTRLMALGITGAGLRKNRTWVRIKTGGDETVAEIGKPESEARAWCLQIGWIRPLISGDHQPAVVAPAARDTDLASALQNLSELHAAGALTDEEFVAAKRKALIR
jgi:hypothetical protein